LSGLHDYTQDTPQSVLVLWKSDRAVAETSTRQNTTLTRDRQACRRRDSNPVSASVRPQAHALDRAATGVGIYTIQPNLNSTVYLPCNNVHSDQPNAEPDHNSVAAPYSRQQLLYSHDVGFLFSVFSADLKRLCILYAVKK
jgi:hypothetical protein